MLKHVQISPHRNRSDSVSLRSSTSCSSSLCGSPEPPSDHHRTPSRASSYSSLNEPISQTTIKIYTACLRLDIEYKTLGISYDTSSHDVVGQVLRRCKMRHRDPRLFYLSMEVTVRRAGVRTVLALDDDARPAILQACHPKGDSRFCLQMKPGGLVRVHTSALQPTSLYKSLVISEETTSDELLGLLLSCYGSSDPIEQFSLYEVCQNQEYQRKLHPDDLPLRAQIQRQQRKEICHFLVRKNPHYPRRRQLLPSISESNTSVHSQIEQNNKSTDDKNKTEDETIEMRENVIKDGVCVKCKNSFKSCEFCNLKSNNNLSGNLDRIKQPTYNPVYNIREIRTVCHSFSSFGIDKKLMEVERKNNLANKRNSCISSFNRALNNGNNEPISQNAAKGYGNFVYI